MKIITFDDIQNLNISPEECYEWVNTVIKCKKDFSLPAKISLKPDNESGIFYNTMPALLPSENVMGAKVVSRYPKREPSLDSQILLYNLSDFKENALMDGNWITAMRTGAVAAHSALLFAKNGFTRLGFIGLGNTARATLLVLASVCAKRNFEIKLLKYKNQHILFSQRFSKFGNLHFTFSDSVEEVVSDSDVLISAATVFNEDICANDVFPQGITVIPIHTRGFTNCDLFFDKVFADDFNHVKNFKYFEKFKSFAEVSDVVNGQAKGRENSEQRILVYNIGIALHDIYFAKKIYDKLATVAEDILLKAPNEKFWV
ncbi:MAG: ornithine cyclodeaminase [Muribaculaceae bacterium]|nr:ornithine cyclodeaminase [Muribaculaceae bacterium]